MHARAYRNPLAWAASMLPLVAVAEDKLIPVAMGIMLVAGAVAAWPWKLRMWPPLSAGIGLLLLWGLLSAAWSIDPGTSLDRFAKLALTVAAGLLLCRIADSLEPRRRDEVLRWLAAGLLIAGVGAAFREAWVLWGPPGALRDVLITQPLRAYHAVAVLLSLTLLARIGMRPVPRLAAAAVLVAVAAAALGANSASLVALAAGLVAYGAVLWLGERAAKALAVLLPVAFIAGPLALQAIDLPARLKEQGWTVGGSTGHRMVIWRYVSDKIRERPVLGWGLYAARLLPDRENRAEGDPRYADIFAVTSFGRGAKVELMPNHPHNATLQLWLDLGLVGALFYAALYPLCLAGLLRRGTAGGSLAAGCGAVAAAFVIGQLSFSAWQSWWLCAQFVVASLYLLATRPGLPSGATAIQEARPGSV